MALQSTAAYIGLFVALQSSPTYTIVALQSTTTYIVALQSSSTYIVALQSSSTYIVALQSTIGLDWLTLVCLEVLPEKIASHDRGLVTSFCSASLAHTGEKHYIYIYIYIFFFFFWQSRSLKCLPRICLEACLLKHFKITSSSKSLWTLPRCLRGCPGKVKTMTS